MDGYPSVSPAPGAHHSRNPVTGAERPSPEKDGRIGQGAGSANQVWDEAQERPPAALIQRTTDLLNRMLEDLNRQLRFRVHEGTGRIWVQVVDTQTRDVIREIPPEKYLDLVAHIWRLVGILVDEQA